MLAQTPTQIKSRFTALQYRAVPRHYTARQQAQAEHLAQSVQCIKPGIYRVGECIIDQWANVCTCKSRNPKPCLHRVALWLAEGVQLDQHDPAAYLKVAGIKQPEIIAIYARVKDHKGPHRIERYGEQWVAIPLSGTESDWFMVEKSEIGHVQPFYE